MAQTDQDPAAAAPAAGPNPKALKRERRERRRQEEAQKRDETSQPLVAFVHIPKTAGGTLKSVFADTYGRDQVHAAGNYLVDPKKTVVTATRHRPGLRITIGHVPYGLYQPFLPPDTLYITFLRDPFVRVISHYFRHLEGKVGTRTLEEAFESGNPAVTNLMTRFLCGFPEILGPLPDTALDDAKANLESFAFVGFQERFDESLVLLQRRLGMPATAYGTSRHVNPDRPSSEEVGPEAMALIERYNQLDAELYAWALSRFEGDFAQGGADLDSAVEGLRGEITLKAGEQEEKIERALEWLQEAAPPGSTRPIKELRREAEASGFDSPELNGAMRRMAARRVPSDKGMTLVVAAEPSATAGGTTT